MRKWRCVSPGTGWTAHRIWRTLEIPLHLADTLAGGADVFIGSEMGIGNSTVVAALACALLGRPPSHAWQGSDWMVWAWALLLAAASLLAPVLLAAPLAILLWRLFLEARLGGMTGDALGAGVEVTETLLLTAGVTAAMA